MVLFALLLLNANWLQTVQAGSLNQRPGNARVLLQQYSNERGPILVAGDSIARSVETKGEFKYLREYPDKALYAQLTGYFSLFDKTGLERSENSVLAGTDDRLFIRRAIDLLTGKDRQGGAVQLTVDPAAQRAATKGLRDVGGKGAVVALDPRTGAILAMQSAPSYDPNPLAAHSSRAVQEAYDTLNEDPDKPLRNRAAAEIYPPGSTFKLVTAAAALSSGRYTADGVVPGQAVLDLPQTTADLRNENRRACADGTPTLTEALRYSCNTSFGAIGLDLGDDALREQAGKFGFGRDDIEVGIPSATSRFPAELNAPQTAQSAIGQYDVAATPLQMAMVAAAIANGGKVMQPYLVDRLLAPDLSQLDRAEPEELDTAVTPQVATALTSMMVDVVENGTGRNAQIDGVSVAGKTGTAQVGEGRDPHAWFVSFAPAEDPEVAVAVLVENGAGNTEISGGQLAAPIARSVMQAVLGSAS
nr:penicillin-binding protein 2 [Motilibacter aurantiacus]